MGRCDDDADTLTSNKATREKEKREKNSRRQCLLAAKCPRRLQKVSSFLLFTNSSSFLLFTNSILVCLGLSRAVCLSIVLLYKTAF